MKKRLLIILISSFMALNFSMVVSANTEYADKNYIDYTSREEKEEKTVYEISDLDCITIDENGNIIKNEISTYGWTITGSRIGAGNTKYYFPSSTPDGFMLDAYQTIEINLNWGDNTSVEIGLENGISIVKRGTGARVYLYPYTTGYHRLYIKNLGDVAIDVNGTIDI